MADDDYQTQLTPEEEGQFQTWKGQNMPLDSGADYDQRGAFKMGLTAAPNGHWPDTFKKPNHPTFSDQSMYSRFAPEKAGRWEGETYIPPSGGQGMADEKEMKPQSKAEPAMPGAEAAGGQNPGGLHEFLFQFLKANPDLAREMSTRMNAVIHGQQLQGLKGSTGGAGAPPMGAQPPAMGQPPQKMAGDVIPLPGEKSMGPPVPQAIGASAPFATGDQAAPNIKSIGDPTLQQWIANVKARQG